MGGSEFSVQTALQSDFEDPPAVVGTVGWNCMFGCGSVSCGCGGLWDFEALGLLL